MASIVDDQELAQVAQALRHCRDLLQELVIRGVRTSGPAELDRLDALREELARHGAQHLAERLTTLHTAMREDDPAAAAALLRAQACLHLFDRVLTMRVVEAELGAAQHGEGEPA